MKNFGEFLSRLGNLHDCTVTLFEWRPERKAMGFEIEDLYFNFEGLPNYPGPLAGRITLEGVQDVAVDFRGIQGPLRIDDFTVEVKGPSAIDVSITFWPAGSTKIACERAVVPDVAWP